jgi:hypothetical protein
MELEFFNFDEINIMNPLEQNDSRTTRNFETLIMERNGIQEDIDKSLYSQVFSEIKNKMFSIHEIENIPNLSDSELKELSNKYLTSEFTNIVNRIKKLIVNNFNQKISLEITLEENKKKFEQFTNTINSLITSINSAPNVEQEDQALKELLISRINWYYSNLDIESLKKQHSEILSEYSFFKDLLKSFSEVSPGGTCGICLDSEITYFIDPCGHTVCTNCKPKINNKCHFCRTSISSIKKVFI